MQFNQSMRPSVVQTLRMVCGSCVLLLYLVTATPLAPALTALLAAADRSHHAALQQTAQGLQVVLRHDCRNSPLHRHGLVARSLTVFAQRATTAQADHVIQFSTMDTAQQASVLAIRPAPNSPASDGNFVCDSVFHAAALSPEPTVFPRPPPVASGLLLTFRSTVLLI